MQTGWIKNMLILIILGFFTNCETNLPVDNYLPVEKAPAEDFAGDIGGDYFVAPDGDDNNPGTLEEPWETWTKAFKNAQAGDTVYFRGGTYYSTNGNGGERDFNSGTKEAPICFFNYPGETPILDCENNDISETGPMYNRGIALWHADNIHLKGLHVRNVYQKMDSHVTGISVWDAENITLERLVVHNVAGEAYTVADYRGVIKYLNCDAYKMNDSLRQVLPPTPGTAGQNGAGFQYQNYVSSNTDAKESELYYIGCRAWEFSDNGFAGTGVGYVEWDNCWAFDGGELFGEGCGFKYASTYREDNTLPLARCIKNCIASNNGGYGFSPNNEGDTPLVGHYYNNTSYHNGYKSHPGGEGLGYGFRIMRTRIVTAPKGELYANNLAYDNEVVDLLLSRGQLIEDQNNNWDLSVTVTDDDFISLDWTEMKGPRKADGSLPDINFMNLKNESQLVDKGVNVGLPFLGQAPDLGAFEKK